MLVLGREGKALDYLFSEVTFVHLTQDDRVVVFDYGSMTVRVFDLSGNLLARFGGRGEGPGEFTSLAGLWMLSPDTLRTLDWAQRRITTFLIDGSVLETEPIDMAPDQPRHGGVVGRLDDGGFYTAEARRYEEATDMRRETFNYFLYDSGGRYTGLDVQGPGRWYYSPARMPDDAPPSFSGIGLMYHLSPKPSASTSGDTLFLLDDVRPEVRVVTGDGDVAPPIRLPDEFVPVDVAIADAVNAMQQAGISAETVERFRRASTNDSVPQYSRILVDDKGSIWARKFNPAQDASPLRLRVPFGDFHGGEWWVVEPTSEIVASIDLPGRFIPMDIRDGLIAGVAVDELNVETIVVYRISSN